MGRCRARNEQNNCADELCVAADALKFEPKKGLQQFLELSRNTSTTCCTFFSAAKNGSDGRSFDSVVIGDI